VATKRSKKDASADAGSTTRSRSAAKSIARDAAGAGEGAARDSTSPTLLLGAHVSSAGGTPEAPPRAAALRATAFQLFTKQGNRWAERECADDEVTRFRDAVAASGALVTAAHDSYLINLASPDETLRRRSIESFVAELRRCERLSLTMLVSHPGNYMDDRERGLHRNADAITEALERVPAPTLLCLEATAGSGTSLGGSFEELAAMISLVPEPHRSRLGICADSCHLYSAGYDLVRSYDEVWTRFDDTLGLDRLRVMHLNDSKTPFNSHRDRHELIGEGSLGAEPFRRIMNDLRFARIPKLIETPKLDDPIATDTRMLERLRSYIEA
jgi:deoxyribonuclease-4